MSKLIVCKHCDHFSELPDLCCGQTALCGFCKAPIEAPKNSSRQIVLASAVASTILLLSSLFYDFISFAMGGIKHSVSLIGSIPTLIDHGAYYLAILLALFVVFFPSVILTSVLLMYSPLWSRVSLRFARRITKLLAKAEPWNMSEIFLIAILVSLIKLLVLADIEFGPSFWAYIGFVVCFIEMLHHINIDNLWERIEPYHPPVTVDLTQTAAAQSLKSCPTCGQISGNKQCPRCQTVLNVRKPDGLNKVLAWFTTSIILFVPANFLPIMNTQQLNETIPSTIFTGVLQLWESGSYPIAIVIFLASILIPILKFVAIGFLLYQVKIDKHAKSHQYTQIYRYIELIGKWSMIDVFVVIFLVSLVQLGLFMSVTADLGILFFALMVFAQIMAVHHFDPRLIWDNPKENYGTSYHPRK